jgi:hypothetical protein
VIPSRFENFPYACIEAMASGLPALVSPAGGMAEMVEHGRTGWIAARPDAESLAVELRRAVQTPPVGLAAMGTAAAASIRRLCDNSEIVRRHVEFRRDVVNRGCRPGRAHTAIAVEDASIVNEPSVQTRFPELAGLPAADLAVLQRAVLSPTSPRAAAPPPQGERTMTLLDILRASPRQQLAVVRRAVKEPGHVGRWLLWHLRRTIGRAPR